VNFANDYNAKLDRSENIDGEAMFVFELLARDRNTTYHKVLYWVRKSNNWPYKAEFYSLSDRLLKTAEYEDFKPIAGRVRPTKLVMKDALRHDQSILTYTEIKPRDLADRIFTKDYLKRLE
jgi:hypothetical protein